jgi:predicted nuclease of predicted toxin-antitoxin system
MKILFDQGTPVPLRHSLAEHFVDTAYERGWQTLKNGDLLSAAETDGYDLIVTTDQNLKYQQNLANRKIGVVILMSTSWPRIREHVDMISRTIETATAGSYYEIPIF